MLILYDLKVGLFARGVILRSKSFPRQAEDDEGGGVNGDIVVLTVLIIGGGTIGRGDDPDKGEAAPLKTGSPGEVEFPEFIAA